MHFESDTSHYFKKDNSKHFKWIKRIFVELKNILKRFRGTLLFKMKKLDGHEIFKVNCCHRPQPHAHSHYCVYTAAVKNIGSQPSEKCFINSQIINDILRVFLMQQRAQGGPTGLEGITTVRTYTL